jgi:hypothetical protein
MTALAIELDRKLTELNSERARLLERLVRDAMALAESVEAGSPDWLNMKVQPLTMSEADYDHLVAALDEPPRDLPRLRELMREPSKFGNA